MGSLRNWLAPLTNLVAKRPLLAVFEATLLCNSKCGYCDLPLNQGRPEMSRAEIASAFAHLYEEGVRYVIVQGGEPTVRKDIVEVLGDLLSIGLSLSLVTNGTRLTPELVARLNALNRSKRLAIAVSLDTLDRERYRLIRGADQLRVVRRGIDNLAAFTGQKSLVCIVSELNRSDVPEVVAFANQRGFLPVVGAYHWGIDKYGKAQKGLQYQREAALDVFNGLLTANALPQGFHRDYVADNVTWLTDGKLDPCDAGRWSVVVQANGDVAPCLAMEVAGNLTTDTLATIMQRFDMKKVDACSAASSCNLLCSRIVGKAVRHPLRMAWPKIGYGRSSPAIRA